MKVDVRIASPFGPVVVGRRDAVTAPAQSLQPIAPELATQVRQLQAIGLAIRELRAQRGMTLTTLASSAGVSYQHICRIENGKENFSFEMLDRICRALGRPMLEVILFAFSSARSRAEVHRQIAEIAK